MGLRRNKWDILFVLFIVTMTTCWLHWFGKQTLSLLDSINLKKPCKPNKVRSYHRVSTQDMSWSNLERSLQDVARGGRYIPSSCTSYWRVAIIIPYRDRENHLKVFLKNMHPFLKQQQIYYGIFVIEMLQGPSFNRGLLMNVGFQESIKQHGYNCFIFHDVDLIPEHIGNIYKCGDYPKHMASAIDTRNYKIYYKHSFGGVNAFTKEQFTRVNGFSTLYFGWGREDDDLYERCVHANLTMRRLSVRIGRYKSLTHPKEALAERNSELFKTRENRYESDGISNLTYIRRRLEMRPLFTWILIDINGETSDENDGDTVL